MKIEINLAALIGTLDQSGVSGCIDLLLQGRDKMLVSTDELANINADLAISELSLNRELSLAEGRVIGNISYYLNGVIDARRCLEAAGVEGAA